MPESSWKPHKSKEDQFLLRNYTPKKFWAKKKSRKNPSKNNEKMSFLKNIIFFWVGFIFYFFESKKFFFSKLRFFQKWHFSKIFFFRMDFFDYFFFAQNFLGVQFRSGNWSSFGLWGFQGDSGTPSHRLEQFSDLVPNPLLIRGGCGLRKFLVYTKCYLLPKTRGGFPGFEIWGYLRWWFWSLEPAAGAKILAIFGAFPP